MALMEFIEQSFAGQGKAYFHTYKNGEAKYPAFLDDYVYLVDAYIQLQEITAEEKYLYKAKEITEFVMENFADDESEYFFFTGKDQADVVVRKIELYDGATPAANSVMAQNILYLSIVFDDRQWNNRALSMISSLKNIILKHPGSFGIWSAAAMNIAAGINEIAVIGTDMIPQLYKVLPAYLPNKVLQGTNFPSEMPLLKEKAVFEKTLLYLCRNYECKNPVNSAGELFKALGSQRF